MVRRCMLRPPAKGLMCGVLLLGFASLCFAQWKFDWETRLDVNGCRPGHIVTTPFPITEASSTYTIKNDENPAGKSFNLGAKYYVDGAMVSDSGDGLSLATAKKTIGAALSLVAGGNVTIVIRGAHDAFDGVYNTAQLTLSTHTGADDTHRFTLVGYGQERPILDGTGKTGSFGFRGLFNNNGYVTIQRMKIQNYDERGIMCTANPGNVEGINVIDVWVYNCGANNLNDGNIHMYAASDSYSINNTWIFHVTSEHTYRKGIKICDHTHDTLIEWSYFGECGYWPGMTTMPDANQHPYGIDCASDSAAQHNLRTIIRYNIVGPALLGNEIRYPEDVSIHHNEFYDSVKKDRWPAHGGTYSQAAALHVRWMRGTGEIYCNVFRDNLDTAYPYLLTFVPSSGSTGPYRVYNNLFYEPTGSSRPAPLAWVYGYGGETDCRRVDFYNNSFYGATSSTVPLLSISSPSSGIGNSFNVMNNIFYELGAGKCVDFGPGTAPYLSMSSNRYFFPTGQRGTTLGAGESDGDPAWSTRPSGPYQPGFASLTRALPGANLSSLFATDFNSNTRLGWDVGALDFGSQPPPSGGGPQQPTNLRIKP